MVEVDPANTDVAADADGGKPVLVYPVADGLLVQLEAVGDLLTVRYSSSQLAPIQVSLNVIEADLLDRFESGA